MYFTRRARMQGARLRMFVHEILPHVFQMYGMKDILSIEESWKEIEMFIWNVAREKEIIPDAERVKFDGTRIKLTEEDWPYSTKMEADEVNRSLKAKLITAERKYEGKH